MHGGGGGRRRILSKDYTLLRDDQDPDDIEIASKKSGASAWRLIGLAKDQAFVSVPPKLYCATQACLSGIKMLAMPLLFELLITS